MLAAFFVLRRLETPQEALKLLPRGSLEPAGKIPKIAIASQSARDPPKRLPDPSWAVWRPPREPPDRPWEPPGSGKWGRGGPQDGCRCGILEIVKILTILQILTILAILTILKI